VGNSPHHRELGDRPHDQVDTMLVELPGNQHHVALVHIHLSAPVRRQHSVTARGLIPPRLWTTPEPPARPVPHSSP
jgi:hypothetical protein